MPKISPSPHELKSQSNCIHAFAEGAGPNRTFRRRRNKKDCEREVEGSEGIATPDQYRDYSDTLVKMCMCIDYEGWLVLPLLLLAPAFMLRCPLPFRSDSVGRTKRQARTHTRGEARAFASRSRLHRSASPSLYGVSQRRPRLYGFPGLRPWLGAPARRRAIRSSTWSGARFCGSPFVQVYQK